MPKKLADLVKLIADKAGLNASDPSMVDLLSIDANVSDGAFTAFETGINGLLTVESAKHNPVLAAHFKAQALLPADSEINNILESLGLEDTDKAEFATEKSTYKKIGKLVEKVKALEAKKNTGTGDKAALAQEITKLNNQILDLKKDFATQLSAKDQTVNEQILNYALQSELRGKAFADSIPEALRITGSMDLIQKDLVAKGAKPVRAADGTIKLVRTDNPELDYLENNKPVGFGEFSDRVLSSHAMLKVSGPPAPKQKGATIIKPNPTDRTVDVSSITDFNEQQIAKLSGTPA